MSATGRRIAIGAAVVAALLAAGLFARQLLVAQSLPEGPVPVAWDKEACARCRMLVSEPAFAAQLQTRDGRVLNFDDPGGLLLYLEERDPPVHAVWLHHLREDRWLAREEAGFVPVEPTPMGYGLGAVERDAPGALSWDEALARVRAREAGRGGHGP